MIHIYIITIIKMKKIPFLQKLLKLEIIIKKVNQTEKSPTFFSHMWNLRGKDMKLEGELLRKENSKDKG